MLSSSEEPRNEMRAIQLQLKTTQEELDNERRYAAEAQNAHAAELSRIMEEKHQFMEEKKALDDLQKAFEKQRCLVRQGHICGALVGLLCWIIFHIITMLCFIMGADNR